MNNTTTTRKRGSGEGNWKKIGTNKWKVTITIGFDLDGKQIRRSKTGTKKECLEWFKSNQEASSKDDFYTYAMKWLELRKLSIKQGTYIVTLCRIRRIAKVSNFKISDCTDMTINKLIEDLKTTMKEQTLNCYLSVLNKILTYAFHKHHINCLPYIPHLVDSQRIVKFEVPTIHQIKEILLLAKFYNKNIVYPLLLLGFSTGMRIGEIMALQKEDIDLNNNTITINKTVIYDMNGKASIQMGAKTKKSNRIIYVNHIILQEFLKCVNQTNNQLFVDTKSNTIFPSSGSSRIKRFFNKTPYKKFTMHKTRHTFITLALQHGLPLPFVSAYVGHTSDLTTISVYTHSDIDKPNKLLDDFVLSFIKASAIN